jgi:hypothetical protein
MVVRRRLHPAVTVLVGLASAAGVSACGDDEVAIASQGSTLTQLAPPTTEPPPTTAPPETTAPATSTTVFVAPVPGCLDYMNFQIQAGQEDAIDLWEGELGESTDALQTYCEELAEDDPDRVEEMIEEKRVIDAFLADVAAAEAATATTEDG